MRWEGREWKIDIGKDKRERKRIGVRYEEGEGMRIGKGKEGKDKRERKRGKGTR